MNEIRHIKLILAFVILAVFTAITLISTYSQQYDDEWWDIQFHYRVGLEINSTNFSRTHWPIEHEINFTKILQDIGESGTFNQNSTRVIEYNSTGSILHEIDSQFDKGEGYDPSKNALGTVVFQMNGTTQANEKRYFYIYFDVTENGNKEKPTYPTDLNYTYFGNVTEFNVNNTYFRWYVDTERGENTSGLYYVVDQETENEILRVDPGDNKTVEYSEFSNATHTFGFDFRNNATFKHVGPIRIVVEQKGEEIFWNEPDNKTNEAYLIKRYTFYRNITWIKMEQIFVNNASYNITRNSTAAGAIAFNVNYSFDYPGAPHNFPNMSKQDDPGSYGWAASEDNLFYVGIVNIYENGTNNFFGLYKDPERRLGIQLNDTNITIGSSIRHVAAVQFNGSAGLGSEDLFKSFVNQSSTSLNITELEPEIWTVVIDGEFYMNDTNEVNIFNRNETIIIRANVTDYYNVSGRVNVTMDLGGTGELNITLYDDGAHSDLSAGDNIYANTYNVTDPDVVGLWNVTFMVYNDTWYLINTSLSTFNITNIYNVSVNITNPFGFTERLVNTTLFVRNYRKDIWIPNATLNCSFYPSGNPPSSTEIPQSNISDVANGTYYVWFTAPSYAALFILNCSAERNNNTGEGTGEFTSETYETNVSVTNIPENLTADNITAYSNQTFNITVVAENIANGTAYNSNITLTFSTPNITAQPDFESCDPITISKNCTKTFNITVLEAAPAGNYTMNITVRWTNSNLSVPGYNQTIMNITVLEKPILNVSKDYVFGIIAIDRPLKNIDNFTVDSVGNEPLQNVTFNVSGFPGNFTFEFVPVNFSLVGVAISENIEIWVNVTDDTQPEEYNGTLNVTSDNNGFKIINLTIAVSGTNMTIVVDKNNYTTGNVTWYANDSFPIAVNTTNIGNATAYNVSFMLNYSNANITANTSSHDCVNIVKTGSCNTSFLIIITEGTPSGNYSVNVSVEWEDPEKGINTNNTIINITVLSNITLFIKPDELSDNVTHGTEEQIGIIILNSTGNDPAENITFQVSNFSSAFNFEFVPENISKLYGEHPQGVLVNASVSFGTAPGIYKGILNVTSENGGYKDLNITIEVPTSRTWYPNRTYCERVEYPEEGTVCEVLINNTGNVIINFTITPPTNSSSMYNYTWTNETNFTVVNGTTHVFSVFYNITDQAVQFYYANYTIDAVQSGSSPDFEILQIVLNPFIKPIIAIDVAPNQTEQTNSLWIYANVTDQSGAGISDGNVSVTVRRPDGTNTTVIMYFYGTGAGGLTIWRSRYPDDPDEGVWGNTTMKGYYNVSVFVVDDQGKNNTASKLFYIYSKLSPFFMTTRDQYYSVLGVSTPIIFYKSIDFTNDILPGTNVTFTINNSNGTVYNSSFLHGNLTTQQDGYIRDPSSGSIYLTTVDMSGYPLGNYTATARSTFLEQTANAIVTDVSAYDFELLESAGTLANIFVYPTWYPTEGIVQFKMWVTDSLGNLQDPIDMNLSVFYPITGNPFFNRTMDQMTKISEGVYTYTYNLPGTPTTGIYDVTLEVIGKDGTHTYAFSAFRIGIGGPYDVRITEIEESVYQNDYLDFTIYMKNMGDIPTENYIEFWVTGYDNSTWEFGGGYSEQVGPGVERIIIENLLMWSFHPPGEYLLNLKVTYDQENDIFASAVEPFSVLLGAPPGEGEAEGEGEGELPPSAPRTPKIEITKYPTEFGMETDTVKYPVVEVKNTGGATLFDVVLRVSGIPTPWIQNITPSKINSLSPGENKTFTVVIKIPPIAEAKEYPGKFIADANVTSDEKPFTLTLFTSRADLIRWEIERLKKALQELEVDIEKAKEVGKDVSEVEPYVPRIREQINLAEDYLLKKMYDDSLSAVHTGWSLLETARYYLSISPFLEILIETVFPPWLIALLIILATIIIILLVFVKRMKGVFDRIFRVQVPGAPAAIKPSVVVEKMKERENLQKQKANIQRVLGLLGREYKEGLISEKAYTDLKRRNELKLEKIEQRMAAMK